MAVVLVIDDDHDMLDAYAAVLREIGHEPVTRVAAASGPETVRDVGAEALLVDLTRPEEADYGLRIIEELRSDPELRELPVILCTAATEQVHPLLGRLEQLDVPILLKPFPVDELERILRGTLRPGDSVA